MQYYTNLLTFVGTSSREQHAERCRLSHRRSRAPCGPAEEVLLHPHVHARHLHERTRGPTGLCDQGTAARYT